MATLEGVGSLTGAQRDFFFKNMGEQLASFGISQSFLDDIIRTIRLVGEPAPRFFHVEIEPENSSAWDEIGFAKAELEEGTVWIGCTDDYEAFTKPLKEHEDQFVQKCVDDGAPHVVAIYRNSDGTPFSKFIVIPVTAFPFTGQESNVVQ